MPEKITASLLEKPQESPSEHFNYPIESILRTQEAVKDFLEANQINPDEVLFSGYDASGSKEDTEEHRNEQGTTLIYFGDVHSLAPPTTFEGDEEAQEEHWMVNPLQYAMRLKTLGIYNRALVEQIAGGPEEDYTDPEYGTYVYALTTEQLEAAKLAELSIR